jgi:hypothetical protein
VAVLAAVAATASATTAERAVERAAVAIDAVAMIVLVIGLLARVPQLAAVGVSLVAGAYTVGLVADDAPLDLRAPLYGAGLLLSCELALWSHALRTSTPGVPGMLPRHAAWLGLLVLGTLAVGTGLVALVDVARTGGVAVDALGALAVLAALGVLWRAAQGVRSDAGS